MKLIDAIRNVKKPDERNEYNSTAPVDDICNSLQIQASSYDFHESDIDHHLFSYPIISWYCTDTHVGLNAIYLDDEPVGCTYQSARKSDREVEWVSKEAAIKVRDFLFSRIVNKEMDVGFDILDGEQDIGEDFHISYASEALSDDGFYQGRAVRALVWYDGVGRTTPVQYRHEGRSYEEGVEYKDPKRGHVLVQDGDEKSLIPIKEFKFPLNVQEDEPEPQIKI